MFVGLILCFFVLNSDGRTLLFLNNSVDNTSKIEHFSKSIFDEGGDSSNIHMYKMHYCQKNATCERLKYSTCFGVKLPYSSTSLNLIPGVSTQDDVQEKLQRWKGLMYIPRCWAVIQPFLCSLYMPKCENGLVDLPSFEMCEIIKYPCRILHLVNLWPEEFNCSSSYKSRCKNDLRELKFNTTRHCKAPLVRAEDETAFYDGVEGCGVQCHDPFFSDEEKRDIRTFSFWASVISFLCNLFAVLTFVIDFHSSKKYPTRVIFYMNLCFLLSSFGYMYQFWPWVNDHTCRPDGTRRKSEPGMQGNLSCVVIFSVVYYFLIAGVVWFIIFAYTWLLRCKTIGTIKYRKDKRSSYYHIASWSAPFILTVIILAFAGIDGDSLLGICFVGVVDKKMRAIFYLGPILCSLIGVIFFLICIFTLIHLKLTSEEITSQKAKKKICESVVRLLIFLVLTIIFNFITFVCYIYDYVHHQSWEESFREFIVCQLGVVGDIEVENCRMQHRPSVLMAQLQLLALFGMNINAASWLWTCSSLQAWSRFIKKRLMNKEEKQPGFRTKHELIARAFAKRKLLNSEGRLSLDIYKSHQDPVGLDFELNSIESNNLSSTWAKTLPKLIERRGALTVSPGSNSSQRRNSVDSEISISVRRFSIESRRHSQDSTVSVQALEVTKTVRKRPRKDRKMSKQKKNSSETNLETEVLTALKIGNITQLNIVPNSNRRLAIPNIDKNTLKLLELMSEENFMSTSGSESESDNCHETDPLKKNDRQTNTP
ncbi:hypothetical protein PGB90_001106 [Kerria lacca]